ncbi:MAG: crossover junction endodeoxyribonuclease RuvC [bacterium]|nr:crossover junction endodeoxyribonuclease RuvC [bacterium]
MIILGIDPGSRITGFGLVKKSGNNTAHLENGTLFLDSKEQYKDRLVYLYQEIQALVNAFQPEALAIENIFYHKNPKSVQKLGEARGVAILAGAISGLSIFEYTPLEVKKAVTGHGNATKEQVQYMVRRLLNLKDLAEENASDALGVALCHAHSCNHMNSDLNKATTPTNRAQELLKKANFYR